MQFHAKFRAPGDCGGRSGADGIARCVCQLLNLGPDLTAHQIDRSRIDVVDLAAIRLEKPFTPEAIADKIEQLLAQADEEVAS